MCACVFASVPAAVAGPPGAAPSLQEWPMFVSPAYAQAAAAPSPAGDLFAMLLPLVMIMGVFWFFLIRPQQRRMRDHQEMLKNIRRGDTVVTGGGIIGKVHKVMDDNELQVDIADNVRIRVLKGAVSDVRAKGEPVKDESAK
jgi:preprotein translocase subunit YajC